MIAQAARRIVAATFCLVLVTGLSGCGSAPVRGADTNDAGKVASRRQHETYRRGADTGIGSAAASIAVEQVGVPYRYGGEAPTGFDCSGLVHYAYLRAGKPVPRTTAQLWSDTIPVRRSDMRAGDVLFFSIEGKMQHVGLYLGDGRFVHAPSSGRHVSVASLYDDFYSAAFLRAGRPR